MAHWSIVAFPLGYKKIGAILYNNFEKKNVIDFWVGLLSSAFTSSLQYNPAVYVE